MSATFEAIQIDVPPYPLFMRPNSSDLANYVQVFIQREYACTEALQDVELIVDCGAYVGYSTVWFAAKFPNAGIIAIEPDAQNFVLLKENTSSYPRRILKRKFVVWTDSDVSMVRCDKPYRDNKEWAAQFKPLENGSSLSTELQSITIDDIILIAGERFRSYEIDILKIDIEGAEAILFSGKYSEWLNQVKNIVIELHDDTQFGNATRAFVNACADQFKIETFGEITFAQRRK
jgi:FkbM family methyltransferase